MKPNTYYRRPDFLVGTVNSHGHFAHALPNQLTAEAEFHQQRIRDALAEISAEPITAKRVYYACLKWGVCARHVLKQLGRAAR